jgi:hypothetical protein
LDIIFINLLLGKIIDINDKVKQLDISSQSREKTLNLQDSIVSSESEREKLAAYFVGAGDASTVEFTKYLENLALETGVTQKKSLAYEPVNGLESSNVVSAIRFKFNVSGKWANILAFLQAIENLPKVVSVNNVSFNMNSTLRGVNKSAGQNWSADLDFSVVKLKI